MLIVRRSNIDSGKIKLYPILTKSITENVISKLVYITVSTYIEKSFNDKNYLVPVSISRTVSDEYFNEGEMDFGYYARRIDEKIPLLEDIAFDMYNFIEILENE